MREFDYIIIGGGCAGLSLAYELEIYEKLKNKTLAIIEPREEYKRDKTWSFWKVFNHNFEDCVKKSWDTFTINSPSQTKYVECKETPYQTIDSGMFYEKIILYDFLFFIAGLFSRGAIRGNHRPASWFIQSHLSRKRICLFGR